MSMSNQEKSDKLSQARANLEQSKKRLEQIKAGSSKLAPTEAEININNEQLSRESSRPQIHQLSGKKILFYYEQLGNTTEVFAGTSTVVIALTTALVSRENILLDVTGNDINYPETYQGVNFIPLPKSGNLEKFLSDYDIVVFATYLKIFSECQKPSKQIWILHIHNWQLATNEVNHIDKFDLFICLSDIHRQAIASQGVPMNKISVVPNFTDTKVFTPKPIERKPHSIMFAGAIVDHKGLHILFAALPEIRSNFPDTEVHIYGSASLWKDRTDEYEKELRSQQLSGVYFHGAVPNSQMPQIYPQHGIIAVPSQEESFGMVAVEAQACGCIPVVHNTSGVAATLVEGETGFLYWPNTPEELAKTIIRVFKIIDGDGSIRERAINFVRKNLDKTVVLTRYIDVLKEVVSKFKPGQLPQQVNTKNLSKDIALIDRVLAEIKNLPGDFQPAGALPHTVLEAIANYAKDHPINNSVETGCGVSTILLSNISKINHKCFALPRGDLDTVKSSPLLNKATIEFIEGPTQKNLPRHNFSEKLQLALIDGAHGYPFPEIDYYFIYPYLDQGALLIIDDIWIPTIQNLYLFLKEDEMFELLEVIGNRTALFRRTNAALLDPYGDGWWVQNYNKQRFPLGEFEPEFRQNIRESLWPSPQKVDSYFDQIREPKIKEWVPPCSGDLISSSFRQLGIEVVDYLVDIIEYKKYFQDASYLKNFPEYHFSLPEKSLEHYLAIQLLNLSSSDIYIEVASEAPIAPKIYQRLYGVKSYVHSSAYPSGINQDMIGGNVTNLPLSDGFATKIAVHTFSNFEEDADMGFIKEAARLLKPGGSVCILPLYLFDKYAVQTDPVTAISTGGVKFEEDAMVYCSLGWGHRHARFYDPQHFFDRICRNLNGLKLKIYRIKNAKQVDDSCYIQFAAVLEKPLDDNTLGLDQHTAKISYSLSSSQHKSSLSHPTKKTVGKPNQFSSMSSQPRIDVVLPATGLHGWNCSRGWVNVLQRQGLLNRVFTPVAEWGASEPKDDDGLYEYLKNPEADIMLLLGFDWHSQPLHQTEKWRERWYKSRIVKIATLIECYSSTTVQLNSVWKQSMSEAIHSCIPCVDAIVCHHEPDVEFLRSEKITKPMIFSLLGIDTDYFTRKNEFKNKIHRVFFRGNSPKHFHDQTYELRRRLSEILRHKEDCDLLEYDPNVLAEPIKAVKSYANELSSYKFLLNLPSISLTMTSRTLEILGSGGLVIHYDVIGEKCKELFRDWEHLVYYNPENPDDLIEKIEYLLKNPDVAEEIADRGYQLCHEKHTIECRIKELIEWADSDFQVSENTPTISDATGQLILKSEGLSKTVNLQQQSKNSLLVAVDGVFFQLNNTGIARVWKHLLEEWAKDDFARNILVLDRAGTAPQISGLRYRLIPEYNYDDTDRDRQILQQVCDEEGVDVFTSTYYTTPLSTPSVFMGYDMIPELMDHSLDHPMWREKHRGIRQASAYLTISENTKRDLAGCFPNILVDSITVAHCGIDSNFTPASQEEIIRFTSTYEIQKPYFLVVGDRIGWPGKYKNTTIFFQSFHLLPNWQDLEIVCVGGHPHLEDEIKSHIKNSRVHLLKLSDAELKVVYSGAVALVYPSLYEGFGMPVAEAIACGCPVITCPYASLPEVGGNAVLYVSGRDVNEMVEAMIKVQQPEVRESLIRLGLEQSKLFSWSKMAEIVKSVLIKTGTSSSAKNSVELVISLIQEELTSKSTNQEVVVVTSIAPRNVERQKACINSWQSLGFSVVSLNIQEEINQLQPIFPNVTFQAVWRDARTETGRPLVYIDDIFMYLRQNGTKISGIINSDIYLKADINFCNFISQEAADSLVIGSRVDVKSLTFLEEKLDINSSQIQYIWGFDYLFFDISLLEFYPKEEGFCMGMPWWDYWMVVVILRKNINLKKITSNLAYHVIHENNYSEKHWVKFGLKLLKYWQASYLLNSSTDEIQEYPNRGNYYQLLQSCRDMANYIILDLLPKKEKKITYCNDNLSSINTIKELSSLNSNFNFSPLLQESEFKVSAIVSTYNSEKFISGRIENLVNQTLYQRGDLEIIVIDSNSQQNEQSVVQQFQKKYPNIIYVKTEERETIYQAWNRGFVSSKGRYVITANADDRFAVNALEVLANELDGNSRLDGVYGDWLVTQVENDLFQSNTNKFLFEYPEFLPPLFLYYQITSHAVLLRRDVFEKIGYYDGNMKVFGDREFMLRFSSSGLIAKRIPHLVGLYYENPNSLSMGEVGYAALENEYEPLRQKYLQPKILSKLFGYNYILDNSKLAQLYSVLGSYGNEFFVWNNQPVSDLDFAEKVFCKALELDQKNSLALNNLGIIRATQGNYQQATEMFNLALQHSNSDRQNIQNNIAAVNNQCNTFADYFWLKPSMPMFVPTSQLTNSSTLEKPLVSVIIPTKDRPEMLTQAIQSVLNQTFTELEIIVVNDGGVDVQSVISRLNTRGNIVYKKHDRPLERSAARNTGIRAARGKYIAYLDDDDNYYPNHIETLVKFLENSEYKIAYTDAVMAQQEKQNGEYVTVHRSVPYSLDLDKDKILVSNCTPNLCLMHEKSCLDEVGLFDETLSTHEDWDLIIRLSRKFDIAHIKETTCEFTQRNDGTNTSSHNRADFTRTREIIFNRYQPYAEANPTILEAQKEAFIADAKELAQQLQQIQAQFTQSLDKLQSQLAEKESELQQNQAEKSQLSAQVETWQRTTQEVQAKLEATQSEKEWVKSQLNSWRQTAGEMQIELEQSRLKLKQTQPELERSSIPLGTS